MASSFWAPLIEFDQSVDQRTKIDIYMQRGRGIAAPIEPGNARNAVQVQPDLVDCSDGHHRLAFDEGIVDDFGELSAQDRVEIADLISLWQLGSVCRQALPTHLRHRRPGQCPGTGCGAAGGW